MDTLQALAKSSVRSLLLGFVAIILCSMYNQFHDGGGELFFMILFLTALNFFLVFGFVVVFLIPLSRIEKKRIETDQPIELLRRYLPIIVLPITLFYSLIIGSEVNATTAAFFFTIGIVVIAQFSVGLWTFLKTLKSA